jgi:hypothetical protein
MDHGHDADHSDPTLMGVQTCWVVHGSFFRRFGFLVLSESPRIFRSTR